jgi:hypothetical protein
VTARGRGYSDPIVTGACLGLLLFATILLAGRGLGASGAFASAAAATVRSVAPATLRDHRYLAERVPTSDAGLLGEWLVLELLAVGVGAWWSARRHGRTELAIDPAGHESRPVRLVHATLGGALMGAGARLAHGCTSGLALTGGALLATGAWLFIPVAFATAFLVAWPLRRRKAGSP